jgi:adenylosuccinate synthase
MKRTTVELVVGLGFGDEGKGTTIDWLARKHGARVVVRFNGGAQAGHNVVLPDGRHHCFAQFGAGTLAGAGTHLSRFMLVNPITALAEARRLEKVGVADPLSTVTVEEEALVTTPFHMAANRVREMSRSARHGSCGMGIGETAKDALDGHAIRVGDLLDSDDLRVKLREQQERKVDELAKEFCGRPVGSDRLDIEWSVLTDPETVERTVSYVEAWRTRVRVVDRGWLQEELKKPGAVLFEGAQGALLDEDFGFHPHTTWSHCTYANALKLLEGSDVEIRKLGILRAFHTRHGAGPFVTEHKAMSRLNEGDHNCWGEWQESFRAGAFDMLMAHYAIEAVGGIDGLVVSCLDRLDCLAEVPVAVAYQPKFKGGLDEKYFEVVNDCAVKLKLPKTLQEQEALGYLLGTVVPVIQHVPVTPGGSGGLLFAGSLAKTLGVPLALASFGPTHQDKVEVIPTFVSVQATAR